MTKEIKIAIAKQISMAGGFGEETKGYKAIESLLRMGEWSFNWFEKQLCIDMAKWLQHIGLEVEVRSGAVKLSDEALSRYYSKVFGASVPAPEPEKSYYERYNINQNK